MPMEGDDLHAEALVELERAEVVVGSDEPEPRATCLQGAVADGGEERSPNAAPFAKTPNRHELALLTAYRICGESGRPTVQERDEAGQAGRVDELAEPCDERLRPARGPDLDSPRPVALGERSDL
jgi:hypothetical protein